MNETTNYREMYLKMARASEKAIRILIEAQRECEEMYLDSAAEKEALGFFDPDAAEKRMKNEREDRDSEKKT